MHASLRRSALQRLLAGPSAHDSLRWERNVFSFRNSGEVLFPFRSQLTERPMRCCFSRRNPRKPLLGILVSSWLLKEWQRFCISRSSELEVSLICSLETDSISVAEDSSETVSITVVDDRPGTANLTTRWLLPQRVSGLHLKKSEHGKD